MYLLSPGRAAKHASTTPSSAVPGMNQVLQPVEIAAAAIQFLKKNKIGGELDQSRIRLTRSCCWTEAKPPLLGGHKGGRRAPRVVPDRRGCSRASHGTALGVILAAAVMTWGFVRFSVLRHL